MKRIFSFLFAIITLVGTTGVFTSCQEDAPEINYTINITVNNDFTEVVNAINNGTMKQEAAIAALTAAINQMNGDQAAKLQALVEAIHSLATTVDAKLAIIEAAMKAQTLALESKLALLEAAIKALPDYTDQLKAIEAAIKGMPDYSDKLAAIETAIKNIPDYSDKLAALETALEAIAENIEAQEGQYADELAALTESIDAIKSEVAAGNKSQDEALAEIIALLESGALAGGGSGGGSGGEGSGGEGEGGEGSGDEPTDPHISLTTEKLAGATIQFICAGEVKSISGVDGLKKIGTDGHDYPKFEATLTEQEVKVYGTFTVFYCGNMNLTKINTDTQSSLEEIGLRDNHDLVEFNFKFNAKLESLDLRGVDFTEPELEDLVKNKLPGSSDAYCFLDRGFDDVVVDNLKKEAAKKGWYLAFSYH